MHRRLGIILVLMMAVIPSAFITSDSALKVMFEGDTLVFDPMIYADRVFLGRIEEIRMGSEADACLGGAGDWTGERAPKRTLEIRLRVIEVMRGPADTMVTLSMLADIPDKDYAYPIGDTVIMSTRVFETPPCDMELFWGDSGCLIFRNGKWERRSPMFNASRYTLDEIRNKVASTRVDRVIADADVIVTGTLTAVRDTTEKTPQGRTFVQGELEVGNIEVLKGEAPSTLTVKTVLGAMYTPYWKRSVPWKSFERGDRWYFFLWKGQIGYYPFAGPHSFLKIDGDRLIYHNFHDYPVGFGYTRSQVDSMINAQK